MEDYVTTEEMRRLEEKARERGITNEVMMERAGKGICDFITRNFKDKRKIVVFSGLGNNGGDGLVAARYLLQEGYLVSVFLVGSEKEIKTEETRKNWDLFKGEKKEYNGSAFNADIVIDAIFGTGIKGRIREPARNAIEKINGSKCIKISVDVPSGLDPDTGEVHDICVVADYTLAVHKPKIGTIKNREVSGKIHTIDIGI